MKRNQQLLFSELNPLLDRVGAEFFSTLPKLPGVYFMKNTRGETLYIGKAKNLKHRLNSYKRARPNTVSRKVLRMLRLTHSVAYEICETETEALLLENRLLREVQPMFNVVNTRPESYYFIGFKRVTDQELGAIFSKASQTKICFHLTTQPDSESMGKIFGVFKGRALVRDSFQALLRLISALGARDDFFYFPSVLVRHRTPRQYTLVIPNDLLAPLRSFLNGDSKTFLEKLLERLLANEHIPKFIHHVISDDLKQLEAFYKYAAQRVRKLRKFGKIRRRAIAQSEIDDLIVLSWAEKQGSPAVEGEA